MDINVKVEGITPLDNGKTMVYLRVNNNALTSMIFEDTEIQTEGAFKAAMSKKLKAQEMVGKEFVIKT